MASRGWLTCWCSPRTISAGVSTLKPGDDVDALIERADGCLYAAKRNGRNRVVSTPNDLPDKITA